VKRQRSDQQGRDQREHPFPERLVVRLGEEESGGDAEQDRDADPPVNRGQERLAPGLFQVGQADGDDQESLEPFPQSNDKRLNHGPGTPLKMRLISF
jgi:hypothetical protein